MDSTKVFREHKKGSDISSVWFYFLAEKNGQLAKCKKCLKEIRCGGGSTSGMHTHLKTIHNINLRKKNVATTSTIIDDDEEQPIHTDMIKKPTLEQKSLITSYFKNNKNEKLQEILARMTAQDGLPFNIFCTSVDIRKGLIARGFNNVPKSATTIKSMVLDYSKTIRNAVVSEIAKLKSEGKRFSLTFDEWTSTRNRRYLNINVHSARGVVWNIGLARVYGSMPANKCLELVEKKLNQHGICISKDIVCITTDGASVNVKFGKLIDAEQQLCLAHGIHLAVIDVLYKSRLNEVQGDEEQIDITEEAHYEDEDEVGDEENCDGVIIETDFRANNLSHNQLFPMVTKIRKVVKIFRRSPTKNDEYLQKYVKAEFGKEIVLQLDSPTRWNSLLSMLERFFQLRYCVQKALIDLNSGITFCEDEFNLLSATISTLMPIKLAAEALCRKDSNLLTADAALKFMMGNLYDQNNEIANELKIVLKHRISQRRTDLSQVLHYLQSGSQDESELGQDLFPLLSKATITKIIINLIKRLASLEESEKDSATSDDCPVTETQPQSLLDNDETTLFSPCNNESLKDKLQLAIHGSLLAVPRAKKNKGIEQLIKKEISFFEEEGIKGVNLQLVYEYLITIPPTSVESERAFSSAGNICTKIRSSLNDESIDSLCFLRAHFNSEDSVKI